MRRATWIISLGVILFCSELHATTIIALVRPDEILIAADSKVKSIGSGAIFETTGCKIQKIGSVFFAYGGLMQMAGFNVPGLVAQAFGQGQAPVTSMAELESLVANAMAKSVKADRRTLKWSTTIFVFGFERRSFLYDRRFVPVLSQGKTTVKIERTDCPPNCPIIVALSATGAPGIFVQKNPSYWKEHGDIEFLKQLIATDIKAAPQESGLPIDILRVNSEGAEWIQKKPECE
jgi:hypothetical protein